MSTVIKVENLSKQYRLENIDSGTFRNDSQRFWANLTGKEDPTLQIGQVNTLDSNQHRSTNNDNVWALHDINFEVKQGEVLEIISENGTVRQGQLIYCSVFTLIVLVLGIVMFNRVEKSFMDVV